MLELESYIGEAIRLLIFFLQTVTYPVYRIWMNGILNRV
jgi:hypothetical protein